MSAYKQKLDSLREQAFTDDFIQNKILLDVKFDVMDLLIDNYNNGQVFHLTTNLTDKNKEFLNDVIKDFDAYENLVVHEMGKMSFNNIGKIVLDSVISYIEDIHKDKLFYDIDKNEFYYN